MDLLSVFMLKGVVVLMLMMGPLKVCSDEFYTAAVQGVVYCKLCKYRGVETFLEATPIPGAIVRLECQNNASSQIIYAPTDKNGYFFLHPLRNFAKYGSGQCKVFLVSSPEGFGCDKATDVHQGQNGARLNYGHIPPEADFLVFSVGPFAFEPSSCPPR